MGTEIVPGWYPDPAGSGGLRYWDGAAWTDFTHPPTQTFTPPGPVFAPRRAPERRRPRAWNGAVAVVLVVLALLAGFLVDKDYRSARGHRSAAQPTLTTPTSETPDTGPVASKPDPKLVPYPVRPRETERAPSPSSFPELYARPGGDTVVTPESAKSLVAAMWSLRAHAMSTGDVPALDTFETGSALAIDAAQCPCSPVRYGPVQGVVVSVPRALAFPAHFLAEVSSTLGADHWLALLVVTRTAQDQPWRFAFAGGFIPDQPHLTPLLGLDGYTEWIDPAVTAIAERQPAALAQYWQGWKDNGEGVDPGRSFFRPGVMTDGYGAKVAKDGLQGRVNAQNGLIGYYRYQADTKSVYAFPLRANELLVCAAIYRQATWTDPAGERILQPPDRSSWGPDVAPGLYESMIEDDLATPCIDVSIVAGSAADDVVGIYPEGVTDLGTP